MCYCKPRVRTPYCGSDECKRLCRLNHFTPKEVAMTTPDGYKMCMWCGDDLGPSTVAEGDEPRKMFTSSVKRPTAPLKEGEETR